MKLGCHADVLSLVYGAADHWFWFSSKLQETAQSAVLGTLCSFVSRAVGAGDPPTTLLPTPKSPQKAP